MLTSIIFSKTSKGLSELKIRQNNLSKEQFKVLTLVDGSSTIEQLLESMGKVTQQDFLAALKYLEQQGLIRVFRGEMRAPDSGVSLSVPESQAPEEDHFKNATSLYDLEVTELSPEESVQAWAEARRGALRLEADGFFTASGNRTVLPGRPTGKLTVLVVEDDESILNFLEAHLIHQAFNVLKAASIPAALSALKGNHVPDLVLLDVVLPGLAGVDGFHILRQVRQNPALREMPVIMITSQVSDEQVMRGLKEGADGYIFKPFKWETVYHCIQSVIRIQRK